MNGKCILISQIKLSKCLIYLTFGGGGGIFLFLYNISFKLNYLI